MLVSTRALARAACFALAATAPVLTFAPIPAVAQVAVDVRVKIAPPALVEYQQPVIPGPGYIWTPGYWAWDEADADYYWVSGAWVQPPQVGLYWTPGYWAWNSGVYVFNAGYWGPAVGFYGGIDYGYGYTSQGYYGGRWRGGVFEYNRSVNNISNVRITNVYEEPAPRSASQTRVSFNGGQGGVNARPTQEQMAAAKEPHVEATVAQTQQMRVAQQDRQSHFKANEGKPSEATAVRSEERPASAGAGESKAVPEPPAKPAMNEETKSRSEEPSTAAKPAEKEPNSKPIEKSEAQSPKEEHPANHAEAERPADKPMERTEADRPKTEAPAAKAEAERPAEKPEMKAEERKPDQEQPARAVEKTPPEKMGAPRAAQARHPEGQHAEGSPEKKEPQKD